VIFFQLDLFVFFFTAIFLGAFRLLHPTDAAFAHVLLPESGFHIAIHTIMAICAEPCGNTEVQKGQYESNDFLHKSKGKKKNRRLFYILIEKICKILRKIMYFFLLPLFYRSLSCPFADSTVTITSKSLIL